ncbi:GGDEF domain-containing protein [Geminicoccus harenae]|uniref:GGDEF domain-containing protein n=1 Tax=Geminicoccus harenae TaxID=2498453 RepID=UPI00168B6D58|nr:GGDEF domain-containing protein [Geminicoccus harenae]
MLHLVLDREAADRLAALTMASLDELALAPLPASYSIVFAYHAGQFPELAAEVQAMLADPATASPARCEAIYHHHFGSEPMLADYDETIRSLGRSVTEIADLLHATAGHDSRFRRIGTELAAAAGTADAAARAMLERICQEFAALAQENSRLRAGVTERIEASTESIARVSARFEVERVRSRTDPLTRIGNRRCLDEEMRRDPEAGLILADIDHFKRFNDSYGHKAGDLILVAFARILRQAAGSHGLAARYGGEEFAILLSDTTLAQAAGIAERARTMLEGMAKITTKGGLSLSKVTASFGVAAGRADEPPEALIERADQALYLAKNGGRNRVVTAAEAPA